MKNLSKTSAVVAIVVVLAAAAWLLLKPAGKPAGGTPQLTDSEQVLQTLHKEQVAAQALEAAKATEPDIPTPDASVVEGTERMYEAHAPLRVPEVADPDSETNRKVLETMVRKALARQAAQSTPTPGGN